MRDEPLSGRGVRHQNVEPATDQGGSDRPVFRRSASHPEPVFCVAELLESGTDDQVLDVCVQRFAVLGDVPQVQFADRAELFCPRDLLRGEEVLPCPERLDDTDCTRRRSSRGPLDRAFSSRSARGCCIPALSA
jgi:hypothetical protein